jgi:hypothetical protein
VGSTRAGAGSGGADLLTSAAALRWARPDLTAAIADHVLETAAIAGDQDRWLAAAGWAVHARSATGDGRETASDVMGSLSRWGRAPLDGPAARRLRVELALVAAGAGEVDAARGLLGPVEVDESEPELRADLLCVLARCAVEDSPGEVAGALRTAAAAWAAVAGPVGEVGAASVALISAVVERRNRRPDAAVEHAADGLTRLERGRGSGPSGTPSGHLAAALAAEWISALLDAGRADEARDGCVPLMPRLAEPARASRQLALLRLTVARAVATGQGVAGSVGLLEQAAEDAAASDAPDLESVCRTALGALQEQMGPVETALETLRLGVAAERRDRTRIARIRSALADLPAGTLRAAPPARDSDIGSTRSRAGRSNGLSGSSGNGVAPESAPAATGASGYDWEEFLRKADGTGRVSSASRSERVPEEHTGRGKRRRHDDSHLDSDGESQNGYREQETRRERPRRPAEPERAEPKRQSDDRRDNQVQPSRAQSGADRDSVPWEGTGGDSPIGDLLFRSLRADDTATGSDAGSDNGRRNGRNGQRARDEAGGRHGGSSSESVWDAATRNGHSRSRSEERSGASADTGGWDFGGDRRGSEDDRRAGDPRRGDNGHNDSGHSSRRSRPDSRENGGSSAARRRHRAEDPWSTGQWPAAPSGDGTADRVDTGPPTELLPATPAASVTDDPEGWLRAALADLDRVWGATGPGGNPTPRSDTRSADGRSADGRSADSRSSGGRARSGSDGCVVVIDVAREGRRFAGRRAGAVVRAVADRLTDRLPQGARLQLGESDALSITMPGRDLDAAAEWMHRTLPSLLAGFDGGEDLPSAQLRAAVHDADGPVGAQILQSLERPARRRGGAEQNPSRQSSPERWAELDDRPQDTGRSGRRRASEQDTPSWEPASESSRHTPERAGHRYADSAISDGNGGGQRHRRGADESAERGEFGHAASGRATDGGIDRGTASRRTSGTGRNSVTGRNSATAASSVVTPTTSSGKSSAAGTNDTAAGDGKAGAAGAGPESTEGLGIADLLAGALAAYRAI